MPYVFNGTKEEVSTKLHGDWFTFKPGQMKYMTDSKAQFIEMERKETGLTILPDLFEDPDFKKSDEGLQLLKEASEKGVNNLIEFHRSVIRNNQVSLRKDLARANEKVDPAVEASPGEMKSMRIVAEYQRTREDNTQKRVDEVKELMKDVGNV